MKRDYIVTVTSVAYVKQSRCIVADSKEEAERIATEHVNDNEWEYDGLKEDEPIVAHAR